MTNASQIFFDETCGLRLIHNDVLQQSKQLLHSSDEFLVNFGSLLEVLGKYLTELETLAEEVEKAKIKAIGERVEKTLKRDREEGRRELVKSKINAKECQLRNYQNEIQSLLDVKREQESFMMRLLNCGASKVVFE